MKHREKKIDNELLLKDITPFQQLSSIANFNEFISLFLFQIRQYIFQ